MPDLTLSLEQYTSAQLARYSLTTAPKLYSKEHNTKAQRAARRIMQRASTTTTTRKLTMVAGLALFFLCLFTLLGRSMNSAETSSIEDDLGAKKHVGSSPKISEEMINVLIKTEVRTCECVRVSRKATS